MAFVNSEYCFTFVDVGAQGRMNDSGVYANTSIYRKIIRNELLFPPPEPLLQRHKEMPYVFIGDDAFPMSSTLLKPYRGNHPKGSLERIFNYRLCRARRVVENVFGILASVFRVFRSPMLLQPDKATLICMTCCLLHNFLRRSATSRKNYTPPGTFDYEEDGELIPGTWRNDDLQGMASFNSLINKPRKPSEEAKDIRREFGEYCMTSGAVEWQNYID